MDVGQHHRCQIIGIEAPCLCGVCCCVPIACLRSHRPTNPCWLHAHLPIHCTGNQLPRQPQSSSACLKVSGRILFYIPLATKFIFHSSIHSWIYFHICLSVSVRAPCIQRLILQSPGKTTIWRHWGQETFKLLQSSGFTSRPQAVKKVTKTILKWLQQMSIIGIPITLSHFLQSNFSLEMKLKLNTATVMIKNQSSYKNNWRSIIYANRKMKNHLSYVTGAGNCPVVQCTC